MDNSIGIGAIIGLVVASSFYVWNTDKLTQSQKTFLTVLIIFPPLQWLLIVVFLVYNSNTQNILPEVKAKQKVDSTIHNLSDLKQKGILTDEEYNQKVSKINAEKTEQELKNSVEYKQLKSLLDSNILTKEEFDNKKKLLKNILSKSSNAKKFVHILSTEKITITHRQTTFNKDLGYYKSFEIASNNIELNKFIFYKKYDEELYFIKDDLELGYFNTPAELVSKLKGIIVVIE